MLFRSDAWFIGFTPTLAASVWIGNKAKPTPLRNVKGLERVTGGSIPAQTWKLYMDEAMKDVPITEFAVPLPLESTSTTSATLFPPESIPYQFEDTTTTFDTTPSTTGDPSTTASTFPATTTPLPTTTPTTRRCGLLLPIC